MEFNVLYKTSYLKKENNYFKCLINIFIDKTLVLFNYSKFVGRVWVALIRLFKERNFAKCQLFKRSTKYCFVRVIRFRSERSAPSMRAACNHNNWWALPTTLTNKNKLEILKRNYRCSALFQFVQVPQTRGWPTP